MNDLNNYYLIMRHGQSEANAAGLIVSDPAIGCKGFGLTEQGQLQVIASVIDYQQKNEVDGHPISQVICSDFLRALETAELSAKTLLLPTPQIEIGLRERFFGDWEGKPDIHYQSIWNLDKDVDRQIAQRVETVSQVRQRGLSVIEKLEHQFKNEVILMVSHGDMLQILLTAFSGIAAEQHRTLPHHAQAEIKPLVASN
jgi:probable phosphoglycerate mutase